MSMFARQREKLLQEETKRIIEVDKRHPLVIVADIIEWEMLFKELHPILYRGINRFTGRRLDIHAHCGAYLLQAMYNWTDRFTEEMLKYYAPARIFCGYELEDTGKSIDHTKIEKFRNRLGPEGAEIMNKYLLVLGRKKGYTNGKHVDMDTTVQEAGIRYPTEMGLLSIFRKRAKKIITKAVGLKNETVRKLETLEKKAKKIVKEYCFFSDTKEKKQILIGKALSISKHFLQELTNVSLLKAAKKLRPYLQKEMGNLLHIIPILLKQIRYWLDTGEVAKNKIISLYKHMPKFIKKGKVGKTVEIGRKIIVCQLTGGFLLAKVPERAALAETDCVKPALEEIIKIFGEAPESFGTDRGMYSEKNIELCRKLEVKEIGIQPRGKKAWHVDQETAREMYCRRAAIEPRIGTAGKLGLKKSRARTDEGDEISAQKAVIGFNLKKMIAYSIG